MKVHPTNLKECYLIEPRVCEDHRGIFFEAYNREALENHLGFEVNFVQDNYSRSRKGVLRGLHFQEGAYAQAKLVRVVSGEALDVVVDLRRDSPTYGRHYSIRLSGDKYQLLFIPRGMAHGFVALEDDTLFLYKCDNYYKKEFEGGIRYDDRHLGINWDYPESRLILSEKDRELPSLKEWEGK